MKIERFEDIEAWKEGRKLVTEVYTVFAASKDYGFRVKYRGLPYR